MDLMTPVSVDIARASQAIQQHRLNWLLVDALYGGTTAMRNATRAYLPQEPKESEEDYLRRLMRSTLDNYYKKAVRTSVAKVFAKDIQLEKAPAEIQVLADDIDAQSRNLTHFCKDVFEDAMNHGVSYILVDYPHLPMETPFDSKAEEVQAGARPYWTKVTSSDVLVARSSMMSGVERLSCFRFQEYVTEEAEDGIGETVITQIREYTQYADANGNAGPVQFQVYRQDSTAKQYFVHAQGIMSVSAIPVVPVYTNRTGFYLGTPPMMELAELNVQHWAQSSDLNNIIHIVTVPFLFSKGLVGMDADGNVEGLELSVHQAINTPEVQADIKWVENTGTGIKCAQDHIDKLVERMKELGNALSVQAQGNVTATQSSINAAEANSDLKSMANSLQDSINAALYFTAEYLGLPEGGTVMVNTSFSVDVVAVDTFKQVLEMYALGVIDWATVVAEAKRRNIIDQSTDLKEPQTLTIAAPAVPLADQATKNLETGAATGKAAK